MLEKPLAKLRARHTVSAEEEDAIRGVVSEVITHRPDVTLAREGELLAHSTILLDGLIARFKDLRDGKRQISHIHVAGDFPDLHSFTLKYLDHSIMTMTPCRIAKVPHERISDLLARFPKLMPKFWFETNLDAAIHREWEVSLGRRSAIERAAHLLCELQVRLALVGLADDGGYALPLNQTQLAECLGLTSVHVNRVLRDLRERGLVEFRSGKVRIENLAGLKTIADFDPTYLYVDRRAGQHA